MTLCATVEATLGGNLPVPGYFGSTSKCISGSEWRDPVDIYRGYAGRGSIAIRAKRNGEKEVKVFLDGGLKKGKDGYFRGQRRRINSVIYVSLRDTCRALLPFFFSTEAIISRTLVPL